MIIHYPNKPSIGDLESVEQATLEAKENALEQIKLTFRKKKILKFLNLDKSKYSWNQSN